MFGTRTSNTNSKKKTFIVDEFVVRQCKFVNNSIPLSQQCLRVLFGYIFRTPIEMMIGNVPYELSEKWRSQYMNYYNKFLKDAFVEILCRGVVPVGFYQPMKGMAMVPTVAKNGFVRGVYDTETHQTKFYWYRTEDGEKNADEVFTGLNDKGPKEESLEKFNQFDITGNASVLTVTNSSLETTLKGKGNMFNADASQDAKIDPHVVVLSGFGYDPTLTGAVQSPLASILKEIAWVQRMQSIELKIEIAKISPWLLMQRSTNINNKLTGGDSNFGNDIPRRIDPIEIQKQQYREAEFRMLNTIKIQENARRQSQRMRANNDLPRAENVGWLDLADVQIPPKLYPVAEGYQVANTPLPQGRTDFLEHLKRTDQLLSQAYGVPLSLLEGEGRVLAGIKSNEDTFKSVLQEWKNKITQLMDAVYYMCNGTEIVNKALAIVTPESREKILKSDLILQVYQSLRPTFYFNEDTDVNHETLMKMWAIGIISDDLFRRMCLKKLGLPQYLQNEEIKSTKNLNFTKEEKLAFYFDRQYIEKEEQSTTSSLEVSPSKKQKLTK